jgi:hypothetical protein
MRFDKPHTICDSSWQVAIVTVDGDFHSSSDRNKRQEPTAIFGDRVTDQGNARASHTLETERQSGEGSNWCSSHGSGSAVGKDPAPLVLAVWTGTTRA